MAATVLDRFALQDGVAAVVFLASPAASWITGQTLLVKEGIGDG